MNKKLDAVAGGSRTTVRRRPRAKPECSYDYKLLRVPGISGRATTVSMAWPLYLRLLKESRLQPKQFAAAFKDAASELIAENRVRDDIPFSQQVRSDAVTEMERQGRLIGW